MSDLIPFQDNHELHGALIGLGVAAVIKVTGRPMSDSLAIGGVTGAIATAAMKTYGHPTQLKILKQKTK